MKRYARHATPSDEIYRALMAERTGENPDNYRNRPFCAELLDFAPSGCSTGNYHHPEPLPDPPQVTLPWPEPPAITRQFPDPPPFPPRDINGRYRRLPDTPQA